MQKVCVCDNCSSSDKTADIATIPISISESVATMEYGCKNSIFQSVPSFCEWRVSCVTVTVLRLELIIVFTEPAVFCATDCNPHLYVLFFLKSARSERIMGELVCPDDCDSLHLWNVGQLLCGYTAQYLRRLSSSFSLPWEPEISQNAVSVLDSASSYFYFKRVSMWRIFKKIRT
jgi:hypothetical protein